MKRFMKVWLFVLAALFFSMGVSEAAQQHFVAQVYKKDNSKYGLQGMPSELITATTSITYQVIVSESTASASRRLETLYSGGGFGQATTAKTNPVTTTVYATDGGRIDFYVDPTESGDTHVDLIVVDVNNGYTAFVSGLSSKMHTVVIDETPNIQHMGCIWFSGTTTTETSTGINFLANTFLSDVRVEVVGISSAQTLDVGITNVDTNGLRVGVSLATAGFVADTGVVTSGASYTYTAATNYGALLKTVITGTGCTYTGGSSYLGYIVTSAVTAGDYLSYNNSGATATGYIYYQIMKIR